MHNERRTIGTLWDTYMYGLLKTTRFMNSIRQIYPPEPKKNTTNCSYLDLYLCLKFVTDLYDKRGTFNFRIVNFPHIHVHIHVVAWIVVAYPPNRPMVYLDPGNFKSRRLIGQCTGSIFCRSRKLFHRSR